MAIRKIKGAMIDANTGEIIPDRTFKKGEFLQVFLDSMLNALGSSKVSAALLLQLLKRMDGKTSTITLVLDDKVEIAKEMGVSTNHIDVSLGRLCKQGILSRKARAKYMVNPYLLAKTDWNRIVELRIMWETVTKDKNGKKVSIVRETTLTNKGKYIPISNNNQPISKESSNERQA